jgi:gas vesicle protein
MAKKSNGSDFVLGAMIGGLVGAATALFLAPKAGKELRENLNEQASVVKGKTSQYRTIAIEKGSEFADLAREKTISLSQAVSEQSSHLVDIVKNAANQTSENKQDTFETNEEASEAETLLEDIEESDAQTQDGYIPLNSTEDNKINS